MKTITVGVLGAGRIGQLHADNLFAMPDVRLKSIADPYRRFQTTGRRGMWPPAPIPSWCSTIPRSRRS